MVRNALLSAMPVTMPGSAIGRMITSDTTLRPKKCVRCSASAAIVPSSSATRVARMATSMLVSSAARAPWLWAAAFHQRRVSSCGGQLKVRLALKELSTTSISGV